MRSIVMICAVVSGLLICDTSTARAEQESESEKHYMELLSRAVQYWKSTGPGTVVVAWNAKAPGGIGLTMKFCVEVIESELHVYIPADSGSPCRMVFSDDGVMLAENSLRTVSAMDPIDPGATKLSGHPGYFFALRALVASSGPSVLEQIAAKETKRLSEAEELTIVRAFYPDAQAVENVVNDAPHTEFSVARADSGVEFSWRDSGGTILRVQRAATSLDSLTELRQSYSWAEDASSTDAFPTPEEIIAYLLEQKAVESQLSDVIAMGVPPFETKMIRFRSKDQIGTVTVICAHPIQVKDIRRIPLEKSRTIVVATPENAPVPQRVIALSGRDWYVHLQLSQPAVSPGAEDAVFSSAENWIRGWATR